MPRLLEPPFIVVKEYAGGGEVSQWPKRQTDDVCRPSLEPFFLSCSWSESSMIAVPVVCVVTIS
jgi:hypothetical protein